MIELYRRARWVVSSSLTGNSNLQALTKKKKNIGKLQLKAFHAMIIKLEKSWFKAQF